MLGSRSDTAAVGCGSLLLAITSASRWIVSCSTGTALRLLLLAGQERSGIMLLPSVTSVLLVAKLHLTTKLRNAASHAELVWPIWHLLRGCCRYELLLAPRYRCGHGASNQCIPVCSLLLWIQFRWVRLFAYFEGGSVDRLWLSIHFPVC